MTEILTTSISSVASKAGGIETFNPSDAAQFQQLLGNNNQAISAVENFVVGAENRLQRGQLAVSSKLKNFDYRDNVMGLIHAMHESSMNSVSVQLTGKIGTKVSESFESLIKQQ